MRREKGACRIYLICAWCKRVVEVRAVPGEEDAVRSYCKCPACRRAENAPRSGRHIGAKRPLVRP